MKKTLLLSTLLCAGLSAFGQTDTKVDVTVGDWKFAAERFDKGVSISEITTIGTTGDVDFTTATFSNGTAEENKIFNIRPRVFRDCTALTSIKFPATLESFMPMAADEFFSTDIDGTGTNNSTTLEKQFGNADFELNLTVTFADWATTDNKSSFFPNQWGSALLTTGTQAVGNNDSYPGGFQIYLNTPTNNSGQLQIKYGPSTAGTIISNTENLIGKCGGTIKIRLIYKNDAHTLSISVSGATEDITSQSFENVTINTVSALSTNINTNVHMVAAVTEPTDVSTLEVDNPFRGCVSLTDFYVEEGNTIFGVGPNGALRKNGEVKAYPYGRLFDKLVRFNVTDANGIATGIYVNSGVSCNAEGVQLIGNGDVRQLKLAEGKTGGSLFAFHYFANSTTAEGPTICMQGINASYGGTNMWAGGKGNAFSWDVVSNRAWSGQIGMSVVPGRELVTFYITTTNSRGTYYVTVDNNNMAILTDKKEDATEFAIEFAQFIEVPLTAGYATACMPVAVTAELKDGQHISDNVEVINNKVVLKPMTGNSIAARTPVIISSENDQTTPEVVTFKIADTNAPAPVAEGETSSLLKGYSLPCSTLTADSYGISGTDFVQTTSTPAGSVIIVKPADATWDATLAIDASETVGIKEVESAAAAKANAIYDLQGRRVSNASKGIFIINGVKTLVK